MSNKTLYTVVVAVVFVFLLSIVIIVPRAVTFSRLLEVAKHARSADTPDETCFEDHKDWWKTPICVKRELAEDGLAVKYTAFSPGRDKKPGTRDDQTESVVDLNKTKIAGKWLGKRVKEVGKGFFEGLKSDNKFEEETK